MINRKDFLVQSGLAFTPALLSGWTGRNDSRITATDELPVQFFSDGQFFDGPSYWHQLEEANKKQLVKIDRYGQGGSVEMLEKKFAEITGKEKAIYMPSGTMANQLAISVLSGEKTKVYVQDTSHVYRDEADAAQSVFKKRLMPLAENETFFTAETLRQAIEQLEQKEVFKSGIGCVSIENPVRRAQGRMVPIGEIKKISEYCRNAGIPLHLDGARIYMAAAWSGTRVKEYSSYFDSVYISLYKYFGASGGAVLCGSEEVIAKMPHLIKIHGGNMFGNWLSAAIALHRLDGIEERLRQSIRRSEQIFSSLGSLGIRVSPFEGGTNIYAASYPAKINIEKFVEELSQQGIYIRKPDADKEGLLTVNDTLLNREADYVVTAFAHALNKAG